MKNYNSLGRLKHVGIKGSRVSFLPGCLNYFCYFLVVPISLKWDAVTSCYVIRSHKLLKIFYGTGVIYGVITALLWTNNYIGEISQHPQNVIIIFEMIMQPCVAASQSYAAHVFLFQQPRLLDVLKRLRLLSNSVSIFKVLGICSFLLLCMLLNCVILPSHSIYKEGILKFINWILITPLDPICCPLPINSNSTATQYVQLAYYLSFPWMMQFCLPEVLGVSIVLSFFRLAQTFQSRLNYKLSLDEGYTVCKEYKHVITGMNDLWGPTFLILYVADVIYYAKAPYVFFTMNDNPDIAFCIFLFGNLVIWGVAAHINKMMTTSIKQWIQIKQEECCLSLDNRLKLLGLAYEVDSEPMGISCSFFTVTYPFLGSMFSILATYALIIYQQMR